MKRKVNRASSTKTDLENPSKRLNKRIPPKVINPAVTHALRMFKRSAREVYLHIPRYKPNR
ncbi:MAG: hypothetical protein ACD_23C00616G0001 [uncultured bacterium]|nr:MAG: hypothetical protein ACD_23C00616G0001 [uncultured bacterium]